MRAPQCSSCRWWRCSSLLWNMVFKTDPGPVWTVSLVTDHLFYLCSVTGGELFEDIVAREYYSEADARWVSKSCKGACSGQYLTWRTFMANQSHLIKPDLPFLNTTAWFWYCLFRVSLVSKFNFSDMLIASLKEPQLATFCQNNKKNIPPADLLTFCRDFF